MNRRLKIMFPVLLLGLICVGVNAFNKASVPSPVYASVEAQSDDLARVLNALSKYRTWTLVNPAPVMMDPAVAALCAAPLSRPANPHQNKFISVYVNEAGREAMMTRLAPEFPQGSLIVKEKLSSKESQSPELLTAMFKREKGYNPKSGDWEYLLLDGAASKIIERGRLASCASCHAAYSSTDYVTRQYLTDEVRSNLK